VYDSISGKRLGHMGPAAVTPVRASFTTGVAFCIEYSTTSRDRSSSRLLPCFQRNSKLQFRSIIELAKR
jgi:hypothetical protein